MQLPKLDTQDPEGELLKRAHTLHSNVDAFLPASAENTRVALGVGFIPLKMAAHFADKLLAKVFATIEGGSGFDLKNE